MKFNFHIRSKTGRGAYVIKRLANETAKTDVRWWTAALLAASEACKPRELYFIGADVQAGSASSPVRIPPSTIAVNAPMDEMLMTRPGSRTVASLARRSARLR
jgi:hypothetical protein